MSDISLEEAKKKIEQLEALSKRRYRTMSIPRLLEVADDTIDRIDTTVSEMVVIHPISVLHLLERLFLPLVKTAYDKSLSIELLEHLLKPLSTWEYHTLSERLEAFVDTNSSKILDLIDERRRLEPLYPYMTQPEMLLIFFMIETMPHDLLDIWSTVLPPEDLDTVATWWGTPMESLL